jgi:hypothetical protein
LAGRVTGGMVVIAALRAGLGVAAAPYANVHGVDRSNSALLEEGVMDNQLAHGFFLDASSAQRSVEAAPTATVRGLEAQMYWRRRDASREDGIGELEERIGPALETLVEGISEGA